MKKFTNILLGLTFMLLYTIVESYPIIKMGAKMYASKLDFKSLLATESIAEYTLLLSAAEKEEVVKMMTNYCKNAFE
ncbi:hypothetical protein N9954_08450 [Maribacter sp.]|nr:hypothetical protein [Maribacter sp.]